VGIASVKFIAKLASEAAKPDGVRHVPKSQQTEFLRRLPAGAMWGVGPATKAALQGLGVETVGDIADLPESSLIKVVGPAAGQHLHNLARGIDPRQVIPDSKAKSVSVEETYDNDLETEEIVKTALLSLAQRLSSRLRRAGLRGRTFTLKLRYADFTTITRSHTEAIGIDGARALFNIAGRLAEGRDRPDPVRLLGLAASSLEPADTPRQLGIDTDGVWEKLEDAVAEVRERFGDTYVQPARLLNRPRDAGSGEKKSNRSAEDP
jgi:DNA polymerase-4